MIANTAIKTLIRIIIVLCVCFLSTNVAAAPLKQLEGFKKVGEAKLKVLFWNVYNSSLYNQTGIFTQNEFPQALKIDYLRDIDAVDLVDKTQDEWLKLGVDKQQIDIWLPMLKKIFPDIKTGDSILLKVNANEHSEFFFNGQPIGTISDGEFGKAFLGIWLDENCSYPKVRNKLIGLDQ